MEKKKVNTIIAIGIILGIIFLFLFAFNYSGKIPGEIEQIEDSFCGISILGECATNNDCIVSGCSLQVCQGKFEEEAITTCDWKECYNSESYGVICTCLEDECQWALE
jgi:eight-cysteine-cluster-containing protein